jgi:hypothetical protein
MKSLKRRKRKRRKRKINKRKNFQRKMKTTLKKAVTHP